MADLLEENSDSFKKANNFQQANQARFGFIEKHSSGFRYLILPLYLKNRASGPVYPEENVIGHGTHHACRKISQNACNKNKIIGDTNLQWGSFIILVRAVNMEVMSIKSFSGTMGLEPA